MNVYTNGRVGVTHYGRTAPTPYYSATGVVPATPFPELTIFDPDDNGNSGGCNGNSDGDDNSDSN